MSVGSRIKEARQKVGLTQEQLAAALGVSKGAVGNYESEATYPKTEVLYRLFDILKCDANFLYQDELKSINGFNVTFPEQEMLKKYRALDDYGQRAVSSLIDIEYERCEPSVAPTQKENAALGARLKAANPVLNPQLQTPQEQS